mmetsp:Transcript_7152/g.14055  ORF Transcript_7152/g.14055 Transcript_7152/m.14055 type:complete len:233 (-) Transcript_7152:570-1268(-)
MVGDEDYEEEVEHSVDPTGGRGRAEFRVELTNVNPGLNPLGDDVVGWLELLKVSLDPRPEGKVVGGWVRGVPGIDTEEERTEVLDLGGVEGALVEQVDELVVETPLSQPVQGQAIVKPGITFVHLLGLSAEVVEHLEAELHMVVDLVVEPSDVVLVGAEADDNPDGQPLESAQVPNELILRRRRGQAVRRKDHADLLSLALQGRAHRLDLGADGVDVPRKGRPAVRGQPPNR